VDSRHCNEKKYSRATIRIKYNVAAWCGDFVREQGKYSRWAKSMVAE
jgi:hypothetical protein